MIYAYACELASGEGRELVVRFPDVPEAITGGADRAESLRMAEDALAAALVGYVHGKRNIPAPVAVVDGQELVAVPPLLAAKLALYTAMRGQGITKVELARRLGVSESAVRKLTNPEHRSHIGQVQKALQAVGHNLAIEVTPA